MHILLKLSLFLIFLFQINVINCVVINSIESLINALNSTQRNATVAFYTRANVVSTSVLFNGIRLNYVIVSNQSKILEGVKNGEYIAGCVSENFDPDDFNVIKTGIVSGHAILVLPDVTSEYPHGANFSASRKDFRNAINLAITKLQVQGKDFLLAKLFNKPITDLKTCKLDNPDEFPIPNKDNATGILSNILNDRVLLVGSYGDEATNDTDEGNNEFPFHSAYLNAILEEFSKLSGPDKVPYGNITVKRVFAKSSTPNLLRSKIHMTEPYFLIDNVYSGSKEKCVSDEDCVLSDTQSGHEKCFDSICVSYTRPITEFFKASCFTYGTESLFLTKKTSDKKADSQDKLSGGVVATIVILSLLCVFAIVFVSFMIWRERIGTPLFK